MNRFSKFTFYVFVSLSPVVLNSAVSAGFKYGIDEWAPSSFTPTQKEVLEEKIDDEKPSKEEETPVSKE